MCDWMWVLSQSFYLYFSYNKVAAQSALQFKIWHIFNQETNNNKKNLL